MIGVEIKEILIDCVAGIFKSLPVADRGGFGCGGTGACVDWIDTGTPKERDILFAVGKRQRVIVVL